MSKTISPKAFVRGVHSLLSSLADSEYLIFLHRLTPDLRKAYGARSPVQRKAVRSFLKKHETALDNVDHALACAEACWIDPYLDVRCVGLTVASRFAEREPLTVWETVSPWRNDVHEWISSDSLSLLLGGLLLKLPKKTAEVRSWTSDPYPWVRRIAVVTTVSGVQGGNKDIKRAFDLASRLVSDENKNVRKGVAWVMRDAGKVAPDMLVSFVEKYGSKMSRFVLREGTKKLPAKTRKRLLEAF
jgi:3-methyladenine DNA glycosylase AlkD